MYVKIYKPVFIFCLSVFMSFCLNVLTVFTVFTVFTVSLSYCLIPSVFLSFCLSIVLSFDRSVFRSFCLSVLLSYSLTVLLSYCSTVSYCKEIRIILYFISGSSWRMVVSFLPVGDRPNRQPRSDHLHSLKMDHLWTVATNSRHLQPLRHRHHLLPLVGLLLGRDLRGLRLQPQHRPLRSRLLPLSRRLHQLRPLSAVHGSFQVFFIFAFYNFLTPATTSKNF